MNFDVSFRSSCSGKMAKVFFLKFGKVGLVGNMTGVLLQIPWLIQQWKNFENRLT